MNKIKTSILKFFDQRIKIVDFKEDLRKLGINFITAGAIGLFITNITQITFSIISGCIWIILLGVFFMYKSYKKEENNG